MGRGVVLAGAVVLVGCAPRTVVLPLPTEVAMPETPDPALRALLDEAWEAGLARAPERASELGDHRFDDRLTDPSPEAREAWRATQRGWLARARSLEGLGESDALDRDLFVDQLERGLATDVCRYEHWSLSPRSNPLVDANWLPERNRLESAADGQALVARYQALPATLDAAVADLRVGLAEGLVANATSVRLVVGMLDRQLAQPLPEWPLLGPLSHGRPWPGFAEALTAAVEDGVRPALVRYRTFLADELLPVARSDASPGLASLPHAATCYQAEIRAHTTLSLTAAEIHQTGLDELERIHDELRTLGERTFGTAELPEIIARLRTDPALRFGSREEVQKAAEEALADADAALGAWFGRLPEARCLVEPVPDYEAPYTTIAYYRQPALDGSRPGTYFINVHAPETRPRHEARVLAFHESIPGHHLQLAIAQELRDLPEFRREGMVTAYVEGWALYTERLAGEMGLYRDDLDRLGVLSFDAWRASRLVVDTGLHALGWSRPQAIDFMLANTPLAENNVVNEVDRYATTPGQALAYKLGQLEILRLRADAEARLGPRFDIKGFHDAVLTQGSLPLPLLAREVDRWVERVQGVRPGSAAE